MSFITPKVVLNRPVKPPVESVTLTLSLSDAAWLTALLGKQSDAAYALLKNAVRERSIHRLLTNERPSYVYDILADALEDA